MLNDLPLHYIRSNTFNQTNSIIVYATLTDIHCKTRRACRVTRSLYRVGVGRYVQPIRAYGLASPQPRGGIVRATETKLSDFLNKQQVQYSIPIYQRTYSWKVEQCRQLWDDMIRAGRDEKITAHFIGPIVYIKESIYQVSRLSELLVIDGQQRLTTTMLILEALARRIGDGEVEGFSAEMIRNSYLYNPYQKGEHHYKMLLSKTDKESLKAVVDHREGEVDQSLHIGKNFAWFVRMVDGLKDGEVAVLCRGLNKLTIVDIALERGNDTPQRIFESMNSTGLDLSQADLIRNYVLMDLEKDEQDRLYDHHWRKMEEDFGQEGYEKYFDVFIRHYLTLQTKVIPAKNKVYKAFKEYAEKQRDVQKLVADVHRFAGYYCAMALGRESEEALAKAFHDIRELKLDVAYPFLLRLYDDHERGQLDIPPFVEAVRTIESYIFRRAVCYLQSSRHNKIILDALKKYEGGGLDAVKRYLRDVRGNYRFPDDKEFKREFPNYRDTDSKYWLYRIENNNRKEYVDKTEYTLEHIMPQKLTEEWVASLGPDHKRIHDECLSSPGNLTLTGYNPEYSNHSFSHKRDIEGGFRQSPLKLNRGLGSVKEWNEDAIKRRAAQLAGMVVKVWPFPY